MGDASEISAEMAISLLAHETGEPYQLVGRLSGGETGAHKVLGPDGQPVVVKWDSRPESRQLRGEAVVLSERLRTHVGWPVPTQSVVDADEVRFVIQEWMPGVPPIISITNSLNGSLTSTPGDWAWLDGKIPFTGQWL